MVKLPKISGTASRSPDGTKARQDIEYLLGAVVFLGVFGSPLAAEQDKITFGLAAVSDPYFGQREDLGFSDVLDAWAKFDGTWGVLDYTLRLSFAGTDDRADFRLDGSQLAIGGEVWSVALGAKERNWSFSPNTSLIWSQNARPVPALSIQRERAPSDSAWFGWMGHWSGEIVFGQLDGEQPDPNIQMFGARLVVNPLPGLDVELVRTAQWGGDGRPGGFDAFWDMLIGDSNQGSASGMDPANQLAGVGLSYSLQGDLVPLRFYLQAIGEDEAGGLPSCFMYLVGAEWTGALGSTPTTVTVEGIDTIIEFTDGGFCGPATAYGGQYNRGYSQLGSVMGAAVDTAGQSIGIDVLHEFGDQSVGWGAKQVLINDIEAANHRLSSERASGVTGYVSYQRSIGQGRIITGLSYQGFDLDNADLSEGLRAWLNYEFTF